MSDFDEYEIIGTPKGMGMFLVHFELSSSNLLDRHTSLSMDNER
ncbi:hypothetical protein OAR18_03175 [Candidatus Pseudothioglobus singularis]|nr:hypothetical protein [Candidatus Pseudothioglobus singularis]